MKKAFILFFLAAFPLIAADTIATAEQEEAPAKKSEFVNLTEQVHFSGDRFEYNRNSGIITGTGNIAITQNDSQMRGEKLVIDLQNKTAEIEQNVVISRPGEVAEGDKGVYDFAKQQGVFYETHGHSEPWYFSAEKIEREEKGQFTVESASLTTCDLPHPHYGLRARRTTLVPDERVAAHDIVFFVGSTPLFYLPYYSQGLGPSRPPLEFSAGTESDLGAYARLGYNLELSKEVTLTPHIWGFTKSGVGGGLNGRLNLFDGDGQGRFESFYISDLNDDNTEEVGIEQDRAKVDFYYRQELPHEMTALLQTEYISDREFLKTFDFDEYSERELPESFFNLERTGEHNVASFTVRERLTNYVDDVERVGIPDACAVQRLA